MRVWNAKWMMLPAVVFLFIGGNAAKAGQMTFDLAWSGESFGNSATAVGQITFDPAQLDNPGFSNTWDGSWVGVTNFTITITGASSGNGTFDFSYFPEIFLDTGGLGLDFTQQLVGQPTLIDPWGTIGDPNLGVPTGGDFNFYTPEGTDAPIGFWFLTIQTNRYAGDFLALTSFAPVVPEPSSFLLLGMGGFGLAAYARRKKVEASSAQLS